MEQNKITFEQYIGYEKQKLAGGKRKVEYSKIVSFIILLILGASAILCLAASNSFLFSSSRPNDLILSSNFFNISLLFFI